MGGVANGGNVSRYIVESGVFVVVVSRINSGGAVVIDGTDVGLGL